MQEFVSFMGETSLDKREILAGNVYKKKKGVEFVYKKERKTP